MESPSRPWSPTPPPATRSDLVATRSSSTRAWVGRKFSEIWLTGRVQFDAFRQAPLAYIQAVGWRLRGLKVRSKNRIAPLAGRSPHAYELWIARHESTVRGALTDSVLAQPILPVIDCRHGQEGLSMTLASLVRDGVSSRPVLVGGTGDAGCELVERPCELQAFADENGTWLCPMLAGDRLAPGALATYGAAIAEVPSAKIIYADDDLIGDSTWRTEPHFKPQWNPDLFQHHDFITGASVLFATADILGRLPDEDWMAALVDKAMSNGGVVQHLPLVLHHRLDRPKPRLPAGAPTILPDGAPLVSIIIPTRNKFELLRPCVEGVSRTNYPGIEIIIIDNGSDDRETLDYLARLETDGHTVLRLPGPFNFSMLNNMAVGRCNGSVLCFLNNDVEFLDGEWLAIMVQQAIRPEIGAVGARLLYEDRTIQHAGVFLGIGGGAGHGHRFLHADEPGYFERARLPQQVSAVTAACMVVERSKFLAVAGFDEATFPVAFNDVDLCLKLNERGWQSFYEPRATLIHHESKSRGRDSARANRARFAGELAALKQKWHTDTRRDPFHHPQLSPYSEQFVVAV